MIIWTVAVLGSIAVALGGAPDDVKPTIPALKVVQVSWEN
jgi:hypothetical protein